MPAKKFPTITPITESDLTPTPASASEPPVRLSDSPTALLPLAAIEDQKDPTPQPLFSREEWSFLTLTALAVFVAVVATIFALTTRR